MSMRNLILKQSDGEDGVEDVPFDICNSPIKEATGWANAPEWRKRILLRDLQWFSSETLLNFEK